ncbi:MAG: hypothetical protein HYX27_14960 [Acidobacteria bacterium]|nr:hypothetical protein [Acidobacteriota bacterium]
MPLDLLVLSVARCADGRAVFGFAETAARTFGFVRLVAPTPSGILYLQHTQLGNAADPRPYDLIRVEAPWADSRVTQPENRVVDHTPWVLLERPASLPWIAAFERNAANSGPLFGGPGRAIRAPDRGLARSILCVQPEEARAVCEWDERNEKYRVRLRFLASGIPYDLPLTDAHYSAILRSAGEGVFTLEQIRCRTPHGLRLLVTLGEPFHGWCYKMVAGILPSRIVTLWRDGFSPTFPIPQRNAASRPLEHAGSLMAGA